MATNHKISLTFRQILELVRQLPSRQKIKVAKELEKEAIDSKLSELLSSFKTGNLDQKTIDAETEAVRKQLYEKRQKKN